VTLLEAGANLGFGPGANVGLRRWLDRGRTEWVLVAPHDVDPAPHCLERLAAAIASRPVAGLACADVGDGQVPLIDPYFGGITRPAGVADGWEDADYPHGTLMAASRRCLSEIGLFDERYFAYCEEADLGLRARAAGWEVGLVHGARVTNTHLSSSVAVVDYLQQRNTLLLVREMSGRYHAFIRCCITLWHVLDGTLRPARRPPVFDPWARLVGMGDFLRGRFGPPPAAVVDRDRRAQLASR
jgi:GT2 family glycosyltransferase